MLRPALALALAVPTALLATGTADAAAPTCWSREATIVGTPGDDRLTGTPGPDMIVGLDGDDRIDGLGGGDVICGGPGADQLVGGPGDDELHGGVGRIEKRRYWGDVLEGGSGNDLLDAHVGPMDDVRLIVQQDTVSYRHSETGVEVDLAAQTATGEGTDRIVRDRNLQVLGSAYDDVLSGSRLGETLDGGRGDDRVSGAGGRDAVLDYGGDDRVDGGPGQDLVISTKGVDTVSGGDGADWVVASSWSSATVYGGGGFDLIWRWVTTAPTGVIDGGPGGNQLELTAQLWFDDQEKTAELDRAAGTAVVLSGERTHTTTFSNVDSFILEDTDWTFRGTDDPDFVQVISGALDAQTFGGDDTMFGDYHDDTLDGGDGTDTAWGADGRNTCIDTEEGDCDGSPSYRRPVLGDQSIKEIVRSWVSH